MPKLNIGLPENHLTSGLNLLYFGDLHYQEKAPGGRTDDFHATESAKVAQVLKLARDYKVRAIIESGDFLDKPRVSDQFIQKILSDWKFKDSVQAREDYENGKIDKEEFADRTLEQIPLVGIVGNHEVFGGAIKNFKRTSLKTLNDIGFVNLVGRKKPYVLTMSNGRTVAISGQSYDLHLLKDKANFELKTKFGDVDIFMVHEALYDTMLNEQMNFMPISKISKSTVADVTIAGHIHNGFGWKEVDGKIFGNPGVLAQQSSSSAELDRDIVVTIIHISDDLEIFLEDIKLDTPRSRDIFDLSNKEEALERSEQMDRVKEIIDSVDRISDTSATDIITKVGKTEGVDKAVLELAIKATEDVIEVADDRTPLDPDKDYRVSKIILENFESHLYTEVELPETPLPTVFIGESSHGKSSILRGIYWCMENEGSGIDFIRRAKGVNRASVTIEQMDGTRVTRFVEKGTKRNGEAKVTANGWEIALPNGTTYEVNTHGLSEVQKIFGLSYLVLDQKDKIGINFQKQEDPWFFIGLSSQQQAKVIGAMYGTQYILGGIKGLESQRRNLESQKKVVLADMEQVKADLDPLATAEIKSRLITRLGTLFENLEAKSRVSDNLRLVVGEYHSNKLTQSKLNNFLDQVKTMSDPSELIPALTKLVDEKKVIVDFIESSKAIATELTSAQVIIGQKNEIDTVVTNLSHLQTLNSRLKTLGEAEPVYAKGLRLFATTQPMYDSKDRVEQLASEVSHFRTLCQNKDEVERQLETISKLDKARNQAERIKSIDLTSCSQAIALYQSHIKNRDALSELVTERESQAERQQNGQTFLSEKRKELDQVQEMLSARKAEIKFKHKVNVGPFTIYGVQEVVINQEEEKIVDQKIKDFTERADRLKGEVIKAETRLQEIQRRQTEAENKIRALGIEPENATEELERLNTEISELEAKIEDGLTNIEQIAAEMVAAK